MADQTEALLNAIYDTRRSGLSSQISPDSALNAFANTLSENNLYRIAAAPLLGARFNTQGWNPATTAGVSAVQSFLGAALQGLGQNWEAKHIKQATEMLPEIYANPEGFEAPSGLASAAYEKLGLAAQRQNMMLEAEKTAAQRLFEQKLAQEPQLTEANAEASQRGQMKALDSDPLSPLNPARKFELEKQKEIEGVERSYTERLLEGKEAQKTLQASTSVLNMLDALKRNDPLGANSAIVQYAKLEDPTAIVRDRDEERISDVGGPVGQLSRIQSELLQKGKLTPAANKALRELAPKLLNNQFSQYNQIKDSYLGAAKAYGADTSRIKYLNPPDLQTSLAELKKIDISRLAKEFPSTPQGRDAFKAAVAELGW